LSTDSLTQRIIDYVIANPGCSRAQLIEGIGFEGPSLQITSMVGRLKRQKVLRAEGPYPKLHRWYPVESADPKYHEMAREILDELPNVHRAGREAYLAKRLQEIAS
jgi:hypothetical protein